MINIDDPLSDINERHKIKVPRSKGQLVLIFGALLMLAGTFLVTAAFIGTQVLNEIISQWYPHIDQQGAPLIKEYPAEWFRETKYEQKKIRLVKGLFTFYVGEGRLRYYFVVTLKNGQQIRAEVTQQEYDQVGFLDGLSVEYVIGQHTGEYYVKRILPSSKNNLKTRFINIFKN
jgi:hypothetical protein